VSAALWLPIVWLAIGASRNVSVWLGGSAVTLDPEQYLEGSPLDRNLMSLLIVAGVAVLVVRSQRTIEVLRRNWPLLLFFAYCAASTLWSDFPFVAFKRWTKALGNVIMVFVVLTEADAGLALKRFLTRTAFVLIPASILIIKYYPALGRYYDRWEGTQFISGVTTDKNLLGVTCLVLGLGVLSRFMETFREPEHRVRTFLAIGIVLAMNIYLLSAAHSATSLGCFLLGSGILLFLGLFRRPRPGLVHLMVAGLCSVGLVAYFFPNVYEFAVHSFGRNTTLTGRTDLWGDVIALVRNPWFGEGFESFFLGNRLEILWRKYWWHPNEAHNGYLETYLTLGFLGLGLLGTLIVTGYSHAMNVYRRDPASGSLRLAFLVIAPIYNLTEAAFKVTNPLWILFLLTVAAVPVSEQLAGARDEAGSGPSGSREPKELPVSAYGTRNLPPFQPAAPKIDWRRTAPARSFSRKV
jgi:O-antigen ligase